MDDIYLTISDLFFNSKEIEKWNGDNTFELATEWLNNYPYFCHFILAEQLAQDFLKRV